MFFLENLLGITFSLLCSEAQQKVLLLQDQNGHLKKQVETANSQMASQLQVRSASSLLLFVGGVLVCLGNSFGP